MSVIYNQHFCQPFYTDYRPLKVMRNGKKIAGWHKVSEGFNRNESPKTLQGTYNDPLQFTMTGETYQESTPYVMWNNRVKNCKPWRGRVDDITFTNCQYREEGSTTNYVQVRILTGNLASVDFSLENFPVQSGHRYLVLADAVIVEDYFYVTLGGIDGELTRYGSTAWFGSVISVDSSSPIPTVSLKNRTLPIQNNYIYNLYGMFVIDLDLFFNGFYKYNSTEDIIEKVLEVIENPVDLKWTVEEQLRYVTYPAYGSFVGVWNQIIKNPLPTTDRQSDINKYFPEGTLTFNSDNIELNTGNDGEIIVVFRTNNHLILGHKYLFYFDTPYYELQPGSTVSCSINTGFPLTVTSSGFASIMNITTYDDTNGVTITITGTGRMNIKKLNIVDLTELWKGEYTETDVEDALLKVKQVDPAPFITTILTTNVPIPYIPALPTPLSPIEPMPKLVWLKINDEDRIEASLQWADELICDGSKYKINSYMETVKIGDLDWKKAGGNNKFYWSGKNDILRNKKVFSNMYPLVNSVDDLDTVDYGIYIDPSVLNFNKLVYIKDKDLNDPTMFKGIRGNGKIYYFGGRVNKIASGDMTSKCTPYNTTISTNTDNTITYKQWDNYDKVGFREVEYIHGDGEQYINTGYESNANIEIDFKYKSDLIPYSQPGQLSITRAIIGGRTASSNGISLWERDGNYQYGKGSSANQIIKQYLENTNIHTVKIAKGGDLYVDETKILTYTPGSSFLSGSYIYLFTTLSAPGVNTRENGTDKRTMVGRFYNCTIKDNDVVVRNLIPVVRNNDNKPGMYDTVNNVFYTNAGTGEFTWKEL